ncbi:putative GAF domain-like protein [Lyophyllum shimeji]|uniref:GAF domain-like protein n=1 Tax=Lyophyllum shimeji TaxID=47721 RepID=A0A9P3PK92_LYOSH|nr:putative GAF domain-like protein [Lyophyllum shimeji]
MPHADSSLVPPSIKTKVEFWEHVHAQLELLLDGQRNWVSNLANAASLIYNSLLAFPTFFGPDRNKAVNWCGFYVASHLFPTPRGATAAAPAHENKRLLLGPFCGKPACQFITVHPTPRGVCADAFNQRRTVVVPEVDLYPGHIACDGETKSEIVCPLIVQREDGTEEAVGVLDVDCLAVGGFDADDEMGLNRISELVVSACDW